MDQNDYSIRNEKKCSEQNNFDTKFQTTVDNISVIAQVFGISYTKAIGQ